MNIAILIPSLRQGGAEKQAVLLAATLSKNHNVAVYLLYGNNAIAPQNQEILDSSNVDVCLMGGNMLSKIFHLRQELKARKIDILFNYLTSCDVVGAVAARLAGVKRVYSGIRNTRLECHKMVADKFVHNCLASGSIYNCYSGAEYFESKGFRKGKNIVIPNGFLNISEPISREDREIKHIVTVGRFVPQKDYRTMLCTISKLKDIRQDFVLDIVGYGVEESNIRGWIEEFGIGKYVNIYIKPDNVQDIVRDADIYLSTSVFEGTSNSIMEALNWSLPVVATDVGDNKYLVNTEVNGLLHIVGDADGMAISLAKLLSDIELRNRYGNKGNDNLRKNFSMRAFEEKYMQLINS